ncbi:hypothetical protein V4S80_27355, partial [Citrobacter freundii]
EQNHIYQPVPKKSIMLIPLTVSISSSLSFYFEPMSPLAEDSITLTNDYGTAANSAGSVGFQLSMDGSTSIGYGRSNLYRSDTVKGNTVPINIYARTRTYAGKVTAGETMSRVKVVIDYN